MALDDYLDYKLNKNIIYSKNNNDIIIKDYDLYDFYNISSSSSPRSSSLNWDSPLIQRSSQNAYVEPTQQEVQRVLEAIHFVGRLPEDKQRQLVEATQEIRYFFDGQVRARYGATRHFNAIRCLNNPEETNVAGQLSLPGSQLAGEEYFGLNRFMINFPDIADIQWWSVYKDGSWRLDSWNPQGEHLDTGFNGWGELVGSVIKLNGKVLNPEEMIGFYRAIRLRNERGFMTDESLDNLQTLVRAIDGEGSLGRRYEEQVEMAHDLGLVDVNGRLLTYTGRSMITPTTARQRKERQIRERDPDTRRIVVPTIFN